MESEPLDVYMTDASQLSDDQNNLTIDRQQLTKDRDDGKQPLDAAFGQLKDQLQTLRNEHKRQDCLKERKREVKKRERNLNETETQAQNNQIATNTERRLIRGFFGLSEDSDDLIQHMTALKVRSTNAENEGEELTGLRDKVKSLESEIQRLKSAPTAPTARSTFQNAFPTPGIMQSTETGHKRRRLNEDDSSSSSTLFTSSSNSSFDISTRPANPFGSGIDFHDDIPFQRPETRPPRETPTQPRRQPTTSATPVRDTPLRKPANDIVTKTTAQVLALLEIDSRPASEASVELQNALEPHLRFYQTEAGFKSLKYGVGSDDYKCAAARIRDTISRTIMSLPADEQQGHDASDVRHYVSGRDLSLVEVFLLWRHVSLLAASRKPSCV
ncbi:hypothetical protein CKM354_000256600 [Cercospora kikuchii]|uniref:Uncharacterized protein n=1 Tax=Cercospora kikuchii TaxID=84275 RepID=A0A9P3CFW7_9PEZI|nr:uncharacterized protein CKM354_000256600 [Cercospora kikuchii]GIZ39175.1 hypothetical protein CKM354_000256600 [Cercospora kikuchii]